MKGKPRFCNYTGKYYCRNCHTRQLAIIPARVVMLWDFKPLSVCNFSASFIKHNYIVGMLNLNQLNPQLLVTQKAKLAGILDLRHRLFEMGAYIKLCRHREQLMQVLGSRDYMLDNRHVYSLRDLDLHHSARLLPLLTDIYNTLLEHIGNTCQSCKGKGNYCEICNSSQPIFAFQTDLTRSCDKCKALFHKRCYEKSTRGTCPKCIRINRVKRNK
jgi:hypothetical protein